MVCEVRAFVERETWGNGRFVIERTKRPRVFRAQEEQAMSFYCCGWKCWKGVGTHFEVHKKLRHGPPGAPRGYNLPWIATVNRLSSHIQRVLSALHVLTICWSRSCLNNLFYLSLIESQDSIIIEYSKTQLYCRHLSPFNQYWARSLLTGQNPGIHLDLTADVNRHRPRNCSLSCLVLYPV
jgi:hypothetical protein